MRTHRVLWNYACSAFFEKYMKNYSRNDELCQKLCLHSLSKPKDDEPYLNAIRKILLCPLTSTNLGVTQWALWLLYDPFFNTVWQKMFFTRYSRYRYFWDLFTPLWVKGNACFLSRPRPKRLEMTPKSAIYTRKRDEEHPSHFYMGVLPENRSTDLQREKTGVCAIQDYSYHKDFNVNISSEKLMLY